MNAEDDRPHLLPRRDLWERVKVAEARIAELEGNVEAAEWAMTRHAAWYRASELRVAELEAALREITADPRLSTDSGIPGSGQIGC